MTFYVCAAEFMCIWRIAPLIVIAVSEVKGTNRVGYALCGVPGKSLTAGAWHRIQREKEILKK